MIYFPEFSDLLQAFLAARDKVGEVKHAFKALYVAQESRQSYPAKAKEFSDAMEEFDETGNMLLLMLSATSRKLIRPPTLFERVKRLFVRPTDVTKAVANGSLTRADPGVVSVHKALHVPVFHRGEDIKNPVAGSPRTPCRTRAKFICAGAAFSRRPASRVLALL